MRRASWSMPQVVETKEDLAQARSGKCVVMVTSETCVPCIKFKDRYNDIEQRYPAYKFCIVDIKTEAFKDLGKISSIPTFRIFSPGEPVKEVLSPNESQICAMLD